MAISILHIGTQTPHLLQDTLCKMGVNGVAILGDGWSEWDRAVEHTDDAFHATVTGRYDDLLDLVIDLNDNHAGLLATRSDSDRDDVVAIIIKSDSSRLRITKN